MAVQQVREARFTYSCDRCSTTVEGPITPEGWGAIDTYRGLLVRGEQDPRALPRDLCPICVDSLAAWVLAPLDTTAGAGG